MIQAVLFDMDGTVFDTEKIYFDCWVRAAEAVGFQGDMAGDVMPRIFGVSEADIGQFFYRNYGADFPFERMLSVRAAMIEETIARNGVPLKDGVPEIFAELKARGVASALVTSAPAFRVHDFLTRTDLHAAFTCVITGERVTQSKPAPDIFLLAARELGVAPSACLVAEDSHNGVLAGYRAGMQVAMIPDLQPVTDEIRPYVTHVVSSLRCLTQVV